MIFEFIRIQCEFQGLKYKPFHLIIPHKMEMILSKGSNGVVLQFYFMGVKKEVENVHVIKMNLIKALYSIPRNSQSYTVIERS